MYICIKGGIVLEKKDSILTIIEIDIKKVAWQSLWMTIVFSLLGLIIYILVYKEFEINFSLLGIFLFLIGYLLLIVLHEAFHLIGFWAFGKVPWNKMDYGVNLKLGVAYATTSIPIPNKSMKKALLLPFWTTGIIPMLFGYGIESPLLVLLGAWLVAGAAGDFAMYRELRKYPNDILIKDDPALPVLYVIEENRSA